MDLQKILYAHTQMLRSMVLQHNSPCVIFCILDHFINIVVLMVNSQKIFLIVKLPCVTTKRVIQETWTISLWHVVGVGSKVHCV